MQQGFWKLFSGIVVTSSMVIGANPICNLCVGQEEVAQDQSNKKTTEPVFRVSKLVDHTENVTTPAAKPTFQPVQQPGGSARIATSNNLPPNNILPGAGVGIANSSPMNVLPPKATLPKTSIIPAELPSTSGVKAKPVSAITPVPHPLDRAVMTAKDVLADMQQEVFDYTAILSKREQINGAIGPASYMNVKFRCPRTLENGTETPFSIYMKFLKPRESAGREVIWVEGQNENKIIAHEAKNTLIGKRRFYLNPTGFLAMKGQRYPIFDAGLENLILKLIEKAERDRSAGPCIVNYRDNGEVNHRPCNVIELVHEEKRAPYEFHKAQVFIDKELNLPVRYAAYDWPSSPDAKPELIEVFTYYNIRVNVGLTAKDFDPNNKAYEYPRR